MTLDPQRSMTDQLTEFLATARWFGGKGRAFAVTDVRRIALPTGWTSEVPTSAVILLATVSYDDGGRDLYQVPVALYREQQDRLGHAYVGSWDDPEFGAVVAYDALHDREATRAWQVGFNRAERLNGLTFNRLVGHELDTTTHSTLFSGEQSNSSVAFGDDSLMKVFRRLTPGRNPDIEIHEALTEAGNENVASLYGWLELDLDGTVYQLALLQQFLRTASDGWEQAVASVRNLFAEADLHADEVGGDFAGEAQRLGQSVCEVHLVLAETFGSSNIAAGAVAEAMRGRLDAAVVDIPELAVHRAGLSALFDQLAALDDSLAAQRIHGDLHLGQTLRTVKGWKLVDFEGEPAKSLEERSLPDSPWRDVAGMLRSFDYAARSVEFDLSTDGAAAAQLAYRGDEWVARNRESFLFGYIEQRTGEPGTLNAAEQTIVNAYEADKAIYECIYEARNRPPWLPIPLGALARLTTTSEEAR